MEGKKLIEYVGKVKDLETAIFANQQTLKQFDERAAALAPKCPEKPKLHNLSEPQKPILTSTGFGVYVFEVIFTILVAVIALGLLFAKKIFWGLLVGFFAFMIGIFIPSTKEAAEKAEIDNERKTKDYYNRLREYRSSLERHTKENQIMQERYQVDVKNYDVNISVFEKGRNESLALLKQTETTLESALQTMYETGVIYPKYQNFVAVSALYEYLSSGRCSTLEGANGAYNLYEMELRQNIVIGQLSSIIANLEGIRTNQYTLYQEISMANHESGELLQDITDTAKIQEHYAKATAEAADVIRFATMVSAMK